MANTRHSALEEIRVSDKLPSPSGVALEILRLTRDANASTAQLSRVLSADPALSGQLLKYANSAQVRIGQPARTINEAVVRLGLGTVRQLALGFSLLANARRGPCEAFDYNGFWAESLAAAVCAQALSPHVKGVLGDEAFTCGLLGHIGRLCLASVHPEDYSRVLARWQRGDLAALRRLEQDACCTDHAEITVALFEDWGLPATYQDAVRHQDDLAALTALPGSRQSLPRLLHLARRLAAVCVAAPAAQPDLAADMRRRADEFGVSDEVLASGCVEAFAEWQRMGQVLDVVVGDVPPIQELVARAADQQSAATTSTESATTAAAPSPLDIRAAGLRLLVVDDNPVDRRLIRAMLQDQPHQITVAESGQEALRLALQTSPQAILTDWMMPEFSGLDLCAALRRSPEIAHTYVIVMTAQAENERLVEAFEAGADDYLVKPVNRQILLARLLAAQRLVGLRERVEQDREAISRQASRLAVLNRRLQYLALHDELTGIGNRRQAMEHLQREWAQAERHGRPLVCMLLDIDHFKRVNDTYGHDVGDVVLRETARAMQGALRAGDVVCRFGGEEFIAICPGADVATAGFLGDRLRAAVEAHQIAAPGFDGNVTVSVGVSAWTSAVASITELLKHADEALYAAKFAGRNKVCVNDPQPATA